MKHWLNKNIEQRVQADSLRSQLNSMLGGRLRRRSLEKGSMDKMIDETKEKLFYKEIKKLIRKMTKTYQTAQLNKQIKKDKKVFRGRMKSNSSIFEEQMALILYEMLGEPYSIYIDQAISIQLPDETKKKTYYPDIMIIKDDKMIYGILELKIDMGYADASIFAKYQSMIDKIKGQNISCKMFSNELRAHENIQFGIVLLTSANDHGRLNNIKDKKDLYILIKNEKHPNERNMEDYKNFLKKVLEDQKNIDSWNKLLKKIKEISNLGAAEK